jgi:hypothetical protein
MARLGDEMNVMGRVALRRPWRLLALAETCAAEELGRRVRMSVGRRFKGRNEFFAEAVAAFQHAVNARLPPTYTAQDEAELLGQFAALKTEFGLTTDIGSKADG